MKGSVGVWVIWLAALSVVGGRVVAWLAAAATLLSRHGLGGSDVGRGVCSQAIHQIGLHEPTRGSLRKDRVGASSP